MILQSCAGKMHDTQTRLAKVMHVARAGSWHVPRENIIVDLGLRGDFDLTFFLLAV